MKKIVLLFVSVLTLSLVSTSCSKDDEGSSASIVGKWQFSQEGIVVGSTETLENYQHNTNCTSKDNTEFKSDATVVSTFYEDTNCSVYTSSSSYTKNNNTLIITDAEGPQTVTIKELSATTLKVYEYDDEDDVTYVSVLKRIN